MEKRKEILNELEELSPILFKIKAEGTDKNIEVPNGYFDSVENQFLERRMQLENDQQILIFRRIILTI
jgi:hypothetical protein